MTDAPDVTPAAVASHLGLCVTDLDRSIAFYEGAFGFALVHRMALPDRGVSDLVQVAPPMGMQAAYLTLGPFVLELLAFEREGNPPWRARVMNEPGLTHLSLAVDDVAATAERVVANGGSLVEGTDVGMARLARDPDGQLLELLDRRARPVSP